MRHFKWTNAKSVFLPDIDAEHRSLYRTADELQRTILQGARLEQVRAILEELIEHVEDHFAHEERLMRSTHYPALAWHKRQHDTLRNRFNDFMERIKGGDTEAPLLLFDVLGAWLQDHMGLTDRMMASSLRNYGRAHTVAPS